ncbi:branched-chain amino acid ABC transporter permease/ATP-binding protein [Nocardioides humi]|uniref:Branched-chain amino acid ABC transporter permease/ATP-binding protein n=1 Tax=Nocardioides humi TaxID=449461 RepID=A0ABN2AG71_9ACTN|nr:branched-chain amino acid ABC transporter permease/ATP-binding protein [Nocardioides humi]
MDILRYVLIGLGAGALYALIAQGLVLVYRGSGILNFAQGGFVMVGGYAYYHATVEFELPRWIGLVFAVLVGAVLGTLVQVLVLRPMRESSALLRVISTLAVLMVLVSAAVLIYGSDLKSAPSLLPTKSIQVASDVFIGADRMILFFLGALSTAVLWWVYRYTTFGRATSAVAENELVAASLGHSPERIAIVNWAIGAAVAALAGALIAPITYLQPQVLAMLVIPALAVGLIANFNSFPIVFGGAIGLGVVESLMARYVSAPGWSASVPFIIVVIVMVLRGRGIPLRSHVLDRMADVGTGRVRWIPTAIGFAVMAWLFTSVFDIAWTNAFTVTIGFAILCVSIVLVTGYAGQLSLAQYVLAGFGALVAARLVADQGWPFLLALVGAVVITALLGVLVALPALRTRGINLAIVTLGLAVVIFNIVLNNTDYSGGTSGIVIPPITIFGQDVSGLLAPDRYGIMALALLFLVAIGVLNLRRGAVGRRLLAVRSNERAAASLGVSVFAAKLFAFGAAAGIAAIAGVVLTFRSFSVVTINFDTFNSISAVAMTVVGGVGYVGGGVVGGTLMPSGVGSELLHNVESIESWLPLISGVMLLVILVQNPSGLWQMNVDMVKGLAHRFRRAKPAPVVSEAAVEERVTPEPVRARRLVVDGVRVRFGNVVAVADASFVVEPGTVHGLIGPNGAGKTTVIDAVSGFVRCDAGRVELDGANLTRMTPQARLAAGLGRSFQSLELFEDLTLRENLAIASEAWSPLKYASDFVAPGAIKLNGAALAAAQEFDLMAELDLKPGQLSMGHRRLAAIARAVASTPSVLCLDEPAAGLSDAEAQNLARLLRKLAQEWGMGVLLVEHNVDMVLAACDEVTVLTAGAVLMNGTPSEVRHDPRVLEAYLGGDAEDDPDGRVAEALVAEVG